jgi:hypothetical protein
MVTRAKDRRTAWQLARERSRAQHRRFLLNGGASILFALVALIGLADPHGLDHALHAALGPVWWGVLGVALACGWVLLGASYISVAVSDRESPPWWWLPWTR